MKCYKSGDKFIMIYGHAIEAYQGYHDRLRLDREYFQGEIIEDGVKWGDWGVRNIGLQEYLHNGTRAFFFKNISDLLSLKLQFDIDVEPAYYVAAINKVLKKDF